MVARRALATTRRIGSAAIVAVALVACGGDDSSQSTSGAVVVTDGVEVVDAWVRPSPPAVESAAFYVTLRLAEGAAATALLEATSDRCAVVVPHASTVADDGVVTMDAALDEQLRLTTEHDIVMGPTGLHLMCLGLVEPLTTGEIVDVELRLAEHDAVVVPVSVERR